MFDMTEQVMCVIWLDNDTKKYSLHLDLDQALHFVNGWKQCGSTWEVRNMYTVLTNKEKIQRIRLGNHGEFFNRDVFEEIK